MVIDVIKARKETSGCGNRIHFNNAGASLLPKKVVNAIIEHIQLEEQMGSYEAADSKQTSINHVYQAASKILGCSPNEVAIVENATRAWDMAFYSLPLKAGDRILTSLAEYASNYIALLQVSQRTGARIDIIPNDEHGQVSVEFLLTLLDERVKLIAIPHVPTNSGLINPIKEIGTIARKHGIPYLVDASQTVGHMPINVDAIGCDWLVTAGRKYLRGPRGTGILYVRNEILADLEPPILDLQGAKWETKESYTLRDDARRFETWEVNLANKIGLGVAIDYALEWGIEAIWERILVLAIRLRKQLVDIQGITMLDRGLSQCGVVTFNVNGKDPEMICHALTEYQINVSVSQSILARLDMEDRGLAGLIRASVHYYNNEEEVDQFCRVVALLTCKK